MMVTVDGTSTKCGMIIVTMMTVIRIIMATTMTDCQSAAIAVMRLTTRFILDTAVNGVHKTMNIEQCLVLVTQSELGSKAAMVAAQKFFLMCSSIFS